MSTTSHRILKKTTHILFEEKKQEGKYARHTPHANIEDRKEEYVITIAAPGFLREDFEITIINSSISIKANKHRLSMPYMVNNVRCEYDFSNWRREFQLPFDADYLFAQSFYMNGELEMHIPKNNAPLITLGTNIVVY